jgi:putative DNA primase/helicase
MTYDTINDADRIFSALTYIDAADRDVWLKMGMAIKSELGEHGFDAWDDWGQTADNYSATDSKTVWRSIRPDGKVGIGSLFHEAKQRGWQDDGRRHTLTPAEIAERERAAAERAAADAAEIERERAETAAKGAAILKAVTAATGENPYLLRKQVSPTATLREIDAGTAATILGYTPKSGGEPLEGRLLVVPVKQGDALSTVEMIDGKGRKTALAGRGSKAGGHWATRRPPDDADVLLIGEGVATVLSASEATGHVGIAALASGNLMAVARAMRDRYQGAELVLLADLLKTTGLPDPHAVEAARAVGGKLAIPDFGPQRDPGDKDMNDLFVKRGAEAVQKAVACASAPSAQQPEPDADAWGEPLPVPTMLLPVEPFDTELLPAALRAWVADIADRMQCPPDFPAVGAMVALSSVIGRKASIAPKRHDDWRVIPNLWGVVVGRPGVMKSPALSEVLKPLDRLEMLANDLHQEAMRDFEISAKLRAMREKKVASDAEKAVGKGDIEKARHLMMEAVDASDDDPPEPRRYKVTDASVEALGEILMSNPWGVLAYRDELNGLLRALDKEGQEGARAFYLQGYDGNQGYTFDRIGRGMNRRIPAVCIALLGGIQPGKLQAYIHDAVSGGAGDDGLLQRFGLMVWPDVGGQWKNVDRFPDTPARRAAFETFQRLDAMPPGTDPETGEPGPAVYRFTPEAQAEFDAWRRDFETALRSGEHHPAMESHLSKYRKLVPALALVCALADGEEAVSRNSLLRALAWAEYLQSHAARAYGAGTGPQTDAALALLDKIKGGAVRDGFAVRDVYVKGWAYLNTPESVKQAAAMLCDLGHLRRFDVKPGSSGGRPTATYRINPASLPKGAR